MRRAWILLIAAALMAAPVFAVPGGGNDGTPAAKSAVPVPKAAAKTAKAAATTNAPAKAQPAPVVPAPDLQKLQDLIQAQSQELAAQKKALSEQQQEIDALRGSAKVSASSTTPAAGTVAATPSAPPVRMTESTSANATAAMLRATAAETAEITAAGDEAKNAPKADPPQGENGKLGPIASQDFKIGVTFFGDYSYYNSTGYGMQFMDTPTAQEAPGNDGYNTFEVNRAYITFLYTPNEHVALRVTPDIYRVADGSYGFRLKYGYVDFQKIFGDGAFKNDKLTFGQTQQPLTDWEEGLYGYRYVSLTPWNFVSLSSTWVGGKLHGPIELNGKEYIDYDLGVFNNNSFHAVEQNENKQFMVRGTVYPMGTTSDRTGLAITFFNDFGYKAALPSAAQTSLDRLAAIGSFQTHNKADLIAFEYDWGHNAFSTGNLFNGAGTPTGTYAPFAAEASTILTGSTHQQGYALFGHARLGKSPVSVFGLWQRFKPNTDYNASAAGFTEGNPLDWQRTLGGISFSITKQFDLAFGDENWHWVHPQGAVLGAPSGPDTNGIVIWTQYNY